KFTVSGAASIFTMGTENERYLRDPTECLKHTQNQFGIKSSVACDCKAGYILGMLVYSGSETEISVSRKFG
ncbi:hypothetical protein WH47_12003, partial [Habropoda laboriosa]